MPAPGRNLSLLIWHPLPLKSVLGIGVLGWVVAGSGSGFSEGPTSGVRSVTLDNRVVPDCPPGPAASRWFWSASIRANTTLDRRRFNARIAIIGGIPPAFLPW
jgi:hypothetical protein